MNVQPLAPDQAPGRERPAATSAQPFSALVDAAGATFDRAERAERAFASGKGGLAEMMIERASADVMLGVAVSAAQRTTQAISTILGMQL